MYGTSNGLCFATQFPVGGPLRSVEDVQREAGGQAEQSGQLPATDKRIQSTAGVAPDHFTLAEWELRDPVGVELMRRIEIRHRPQGLGVPRVDDLASESADETDALGVRCQVNRFGKGVVEVEL